MHVRCFSPCFLGGICVALQALRCVDGGKLGVIRSVGRAAAIKAERWEDQGLEEISADGMVSLRKTLP